MENGKMINKMVDNQQASALLEGLDEEGLRAVLGLLGAEKKAVVRLAGNGKIMSLTKAAADALGLKVGEEVAIRLSGSNSELLREALSRGEPALFADHLGAQRMYDIKAVPVGEGALLLLMPREAQTLLDVRIHMDARDSMQLIAMAAHSMDGKTPAEYEGLLMEDMGLREALKGSPGLYKAVRQREGAIYEMLKKQDAYRYRLLRRALLKLQRTLVHAEHLQDSDIPGSKPVFTECDLAALCREGVKAFQDLSGAEVDVRAPRTLSAVFDPDWMMGALLNLLTNAVHAEHIVVRAMHQEGNFLMSVEDDGEGVPVEELESLYNAWHEEFDSDGYLLAGHRPGTGLPVVWTAAAYHGGRVFYEKLEKGGAFRLSFPDCLIPELPEVRSSLIPESGFSVVDVELSVL